jgi:hypothetical protein
MANKKHFLIGILGISLVCMVLFMGCENDPDPEDDPPGTAVTLDALGNPAGLWNKSVDGVRWSMKVTDIATGAGWISKIGTFSQEPVTYKVQNQGYKLRIIFDDTSTEDEVYECWFDDDGYLVLKIGDVEYPFERRTGGAD